MSDEPDNLLLIYLQRLDEKIDRLALAVADIGCCIISLDAKAALIHGDFAAQSKRLDRIDQRLERIERRLDIVGA